VRRGRVDDPRLRIFAKRYRFFRRRVGQAQEYHVRAVNAILSRRRILTKLVRQND
jgi:hypothetical protein